MSKRAYVFFSFVQTTQHFLYYFWHMAFIEEESIQKILFHSRLFVPSLTPGYFYLKFGYFSHQ